jgi:tRNA/tmRNA/rRNA uracil-C5-methylase (TrmA/RlmC/RlmD family)
VEIALTGIAAGGDAIGRLADGRVTFVTGGLPGETVDVDIIRTHRDYAQGRISEVLRPSVDRVLAPCPFVLRGCGGCTWQHVAPAAQLPLKVGIVAEALRRIAHIGDVPVVASPAERGVVPFVGYRTSARLAVDGTGRPAYHRRASRDVVGVDSCLVAHPRLAELIAASRFPDAQTVTMRVSAATGEAVAVAAPGSDQPPPSVREVVAGRQWRVSATSFFQSGPQAAQVLVNAVRAAAGPAIGDGATVADLYAGVGVLGGALAASYRDVSLVAVESDPVAASDARANLTGATILEQPVADIDPFPTDLVVADPARPGLGPSASRAVASLAAPVVVLVSCDPASMARDVKLLGALGYRLERVEVLDLFPGTFHVEAVSRLSKISAE